MNALLMYLLFRFWRQLVFALVVDIAARLWLSDSTAINVLVFAGAFAFAEGAHLLDARRRAREGLPPPSRRMLVATTAALCLVPGGAVGFGLLAGRHFPSESGAVAAPKKPKPPHTHRTVEKLTGAAWDADVGFTLFGVGRPGSVRTVTGPPVTPAPGEKLTVVDLLVVTGGDWATPFCSRGYGALLVDASGRRFETVARENAVRGMSDDYFKGSRVCDPLPPSSVKYQKLVFQLPATDPVAGLAVWDWQEVSDKLGRTYVYFRIDESHHDPDLGATAWGPSRDR